MVHQAHLGETKYRPPARASKTLGAFAASTTERPTGDSAESPGVRFDIRARGDLLAPTRRGFLWVGQRAARPFPERRPANPASVNSFGPRSPTRASTGTESPDLVVLDFRWLPAGARRMPRRDSAEPAGAFHDWADPDPHPFNLSRRRLCNPLGRSLGCAAHCFAISVVPAPPSRLPSPRSIRSLA